MHQERGAVLEEEVVVREPTRADLPAIRGLFGAVRNRSRPTGYEEWHLFDTPWGDAPALAAFHDDVCIGLYLTLPSALRLGSETVPAVQAMDVMVHPEYRLRGIFARLAEETVKTAEARGFEVAYGFPNETSFPIYIRYRNAQHVGDVISYAAYTRVPWWRRAAAAGPSLDLDATRPADTELASLVDALHADSTACRVEKSIAYLDWRYAEPSGDTYEWLTLREGSGRALAVALIGDRPADRERGSALVARVHELFAGEPDHAAMLVRLALARAAERGLDKLQLLVKDPIVEAGLAATPFRPESAVHFVLRKLTTRIQGGNVHHFPFWRLISGDMDVY